MRQQAYDDDMIAGTAEPVYKFDHGVLHDEDVRISAESVRVGGHTVNLDRESPFADMRIA